VFEIKKYIAYHHIKSLLTFYAHADGTNTYNILSSTIFLNINHTSLSSWISKRT